MITGAPSFTKATRLLVVPRSIPTTLDIHLPFDARKEVIYVVALEDTLAQRFENGPAVSVGRPAIDQRIPLRRQLLELRFVRGAFLFDRTACFLQARFQLIGRRA